MTWLLDGPERRPWHEKKKDSSSRDTLAQCFVRDFETAAKLAATHGKNKVKNVSPAGN